MKKYIFVLSIICLLLNACNSDGNVQNSLDWEGSYFGVIPCADCSGIETFITLNANETYYISWKYREKENTANQNVGTFRWDANGNTIVLGNIDEGRYPTRYKVGKNQLIQLDMAGNVITGNLAQNYILAKDSSIQRNEYKVVKTDNFTVTGDGSNANWAKAEWLLLTQRRPSAIDESRATKAKVMYSETGIYCLFDCLDKKITADMQADFMDLWTQDVVEIFFWPDESIPFYFEYEISPLNYELAIMISNNNWELLRWQPFHYEENRRTQHATTIRGGEKRPNATISGWTAEFFIPYKMLSPLRNVPPKSGDKWRANLYRMDYDDNSRMSWSWCLTERNFHDYSKFGNLWFE